MKITYCAVVLLAGTVGIGSLPEARGQPHSHAAHHAHHQHGTLLDVPLSEAPKIVELKVVKDAGSGYNLFIRTENFAFTPELVNAPHAPGKGHAHIYVDGVKISRLYGPAFHIEKLAQGTRRIDVTLNANDHREYAVGGKKISASATVSVP